MANSRLVPNASEQRDKHLAENHTMQHTIHGFQLDKVQNEVGPNKYNDAREVPPTSTHQQQTVRAGPFLIEEVTFMMTHVRSQHNRISQYSDRGIDATEASTACLLLDSQ